LLELRKEAVAELRIMPGDAGSGPENVSLNATIRARSQAYSQLLMALDYFLLEIHVKSKDDTKGSDNPEDYFTGESW
jgi:hypothetical protein